MPHRASRTLGAQPTLDKVFSVAGGCGPRGDTPTGEGNHFTEPGPKEARPAEAAAGDRSPLTPDFTLAQRTTRVKTSVLCPGVVNTRILEWARNRPSEL